MRSGIPQPTASNAMADGSFPLYDANGVQRSSVSYHSVGRYAIACYPGDFQLVIQAKLDNGEIMPRYMDGTRVVAGSGRRVADKFRRRGPR
jgi:hypothetical protein